MHISLDSALGRQRRLNQVGETISSIAAPTAAYSLRSITGGDPKVVRVRRDSDNSEQDFTASEVSSGALVDFVNRQVIAPLDIRALDNDGRTGNFLIAKAAYSLRSLGTRQATITSSGDTDGDTSGKFVCQVRRSFDDKIKSFTADEITDGTLLSFVNEIQTLGTVSNSVGNNSFVLTNASNTGFTATLSSGTGVCGWPFAAKSGDKVTVSFDAVVRSGSPQFIPRKATALSGSNLANTVSNAALAINSSGSYSTEFTYDSDEAGSLTFSEGDAGSDFDISNFQVTAFKGAGHVKTWYDQSVTTEAGDTATGNHATQATAANQPKIVDAGSLITGGGIAFDGSDDQLNFTALNASDLAIFSVLKFDDVSSQKRILGDSSDNSEGFGIGNATNGFFRGNGGSSLSPSLGATISTSGDFLYSLTRTSGTITFFTKGTASGTNTRTDAFKADSIGGSTNPIDGNVKEIIIYNTDQTFNRAAIEANLGEHYSISGIPAFDNTVNGLVETWYDQSGNGNNATQATSGSQPKIVDAGSLVTGGLLFDGSNDVLSANNLASVVSGEDRPLSVFTVAIRQSATGIKALWAFERSTTTTPSIQVSSHPFLDKYGYKISDDSATAKQETDAAYTDDTQFLMTFASSGTLLDFGKNGTLSQDDEDVDVGTITLDRFTIGGGVHSDVLEHIGSINEMIVYTSDQRNNRTAIETNINNHYSIF